MRDERQVKNAMAFPESPISLVTSSINKVKEFEAVLGYGNVERIALDIGEIQSLDVVEVVRAKALSAYAIVGKAVVVEDTGLEIAAWNGLPGALIKWFMATVGCEGIVRMLYGEGNRQAIARTAIALAGGSGVRVAIGERTGTISDKVRGGFGFGFDPIFIPEGSSMTYGEMDPAEKYLGSHRTLALAAFERLLVQD